ncbi:DUF3160 domain-containing protein [Deinococcus yavapaiensis]|uniref:Uncharacterized protein DUF3160 n=1 Tax=Deinococcus yavapaiensis KR-236 TaxID=694435 RepID=A0A318S342_9DEIO|nr:DUF3160 domain-containing protein [Deinococcus yavapaiensis]PYE50429.1 uncharacterized protein DUF3160 [Deinococcus yavapaiensis KR-236]
MLRLPRLRRSLVLASLLLGPAVAQSSGTSLPVALDRLSNAAALKATTEGRADFPLTATQRQVLAQQGFVIAPAKWRQFHHVYEDTRYMYQPVFVTTDSVLHVYHLTFDKLLRDLERERLAPNLTRMLDALVADAQAYVARAKDTTLEGDARKALAYLAVARQLIKPQAAVPAEVANLVQGELRQIMNAKGTQPSVIFSQGVPAREAMREDYTQYKPRGHYTKTAALQRYFRAMMYLGRMNLRVRSDSETRVALILTRLIDQNADVRALWASVYEPTSFLVGKSDDLTFAQYAPLARQTFGTNLLAFADAGKLAAFKAQAAKLLPPQINSLWLTLRQQRGADTVGWRLMGQRFTLDAYVLDQLTWRNVGVLKQERWLPKALDVFAAFGSSAAFNALKASGDTKFRNYESQLTALKAKIGAFDRATWTQNVYWSWLDVLRSAAVPDARDARYPAFMRTPAWSKKELQTALGSYTELKHDTVLYAKQVLAEMGGGLEPEHPRSYVEPNVDVYSKLRALTKQTRDGLSGRGLLSARTKENLESLGSMLAFLQSVSERQLSGGKLTADEYDRLFYFGGWLEEMTLNATDPAGGPENGGPAFDESEQAALVTDIASSPNGEVLQEATGPVYEVYAIVPNGRGGLQLARGGVYSYFEFTGPISDRLTDEAWRARVKAGRLPPQPAWLQGVVVK